MPVASGTFFDYNLNLAYFKGVKSTLICLLKMDLCV